MGDTKRKAKKSTPVMLRMPDELLERIDAHIKVMERNTPGVIVSRGDAMRSLIISGLTQAKAA